MSSIETASAVRKYGQRSEDRVEVIGSDQRTIIVVADGAGGTGAGDVAAESVVRDIKSNFDSVNSASDWVELMRQTDQRIGAGESTVVVVDVRPYGIAGASVGDSQAWIVNDGEIFDLTASQVRKPLLGSGSAQPIGFTHPPLAGLLLVATDGFFDYAKREDIVRLVSQTEFFEISRKCIEFVQLQSGELWDDVGIVVGRNKPQHQPRTRYEI